MMKKKVFDKECEDFEEKIGLQVVTLINVLASLIAQFDESDDCLKRVTDHLKDKYLDYKEHEDRQLP